VNYILKKKLIVGMIKPLVNLVDLIERRFMYIHIM